MNKVFFEELYVKFVTLIKTMMKILLSIVLYAAFLVIKPVLVY